MKNIGFNRTEFKRYKGIKLDVMGDARQGQNVHLRLHFEPGAGVRGIASGYASPPRIVESDGFEPSTAHLSPPERMFSAGDDSYLTAARTLLVVDTWGQTVQAAMQSGRLSDKGRREAIVEGTRQALNVSGTLFARLEQIRGELAQRHAALYAPPARDASKGDDTIDVWLYDRFERMPVHEQLARVTDGKPETQRLVLALARMPDPHGLHAEVRKSIDEAWSTNVARLQPEAAEKLSIAEAANDWSIGLSKWIARLLTDPTNSSATGGIDRFEVYKTVKGANAINLIDMPASDIVMWERKIADIAAAA